MPSVYEFQKSTKKFGNWLQYMNFKNLRKVNFKILPKSSVMPSVYKFQKSTKKFGNGFSM